MDPLLRDIAILVGLLGPTGLIGYVWRSAVWKTRMEARLYRLEERDRGLDAGLQKIERLIGEATRDSTDRDRELRHALKEDIRRVEDMIARHGAHVFPKRDRTGA